MRRRGGEERIMRGVRRPRRVAIAGICLAMLTALAAATGWVMMIRPRPAAATPPWINAALAPRARGAAAGPDDPRGKGRADDPGRAGRGQRRPRPDHHLAARVAAVGGQ